MGPEVTTHGLWAASAPPAPLTPALTAERSADVVIVGAGYTGLSAALYLAERKASVIVLEARQVGSGGSGRNVGLVNAGLWLPPDEVCAALSPPFGERIVERLGRGPTLVFDLIERLGIQCDAVRAGTLHCAIGAAGLKDLRAREHQWRTRGAPVQLLGADDTRERIGGGRYTGALLDRRAGTVQPLSYARGLAAAAIRAGAVIFSESPVLDRLPSGAAWRLTTPGGAVTAPVVLLATNAYSDGPLIRYRDELVRLPYFNIATAPLPTEIRPRILSGGQGCWDTATILSSFRLDAAGRLIFGSVGALRGPAKSIHTAWVRRAIARIFPQVRDISLESAWYGQIGMTSDAVPRLHREDEGVFAVLGYNGRGIAPGTVFGRELAQLALGETGIADCSLPLTEHRQAQARRLKESYYEVGAGIAHLATSS